MCYLNMLEILYNNEQGNSFFFYFSTWCATYNIAIKTICGKYYKLSVTTLKLYDKSAIFTALLGQTRFFTYLPHTCHIYITCPSRNFFRVESGFFFAPIFLNKSEYPLLSRKKNPGFLIGPKRSSHFLFIKPALSRFFGNLWRVAIPFFKIPDRHSRF